MASTRMAFAIGRSIGHEMSIVNIGHLDTPGLDVDEVQALIIQHLEGLDGVEVHGHVGASFIENVFSCVAKVIGKRVSQNGSRSIIINDGIFNSFGRLMVDDSFQVENVKSIKNDEKVKVDIFGSSGDEMDAISEDQVLDFDVNENDWLLFPKMGAFCIGLDSNMASVALPTKLGKFRIFIHDNDSNSDVNENVDANDASEALMRAIGGHNLSPPSLTPMMASSEVVEIVLLDVYGNQHVRLPQ